MKKIALFSHDAGGAEILSNWAKNHTNKYLIKVAGPAEDIYKKNKLDHFFSDMSVSEVIDFSDLIICSTSWDSLLEINAIKEALAKNKKCISILDHWANYKERFQDSSDKIYLPNEIWVCDTYAEDLARSLFQNTKIKLIENPYLVSIREEINEKISKTVKKNNQVLYVGEPVADHALKEFGDSNHFGYTEKEALMYFLDNFKNLFDDKFYLKIRPHPSEDNDKYNWVMEYASIKIEINKNFSLIEDVCNSEVVVGCESMAMVVGLMTSKRVISAIPKGGKKCELPYKEIEMLQNIL